MALGLGYEHVKSVLAIEKRHANNDSRICQRGLILLVPHYGGGVTETLAVVIACLCHRHSKSEQRTHLEYKSFQVETVGET